MHKYLVLGGNGFLGRHLVNALVGQRNFVRVADLTAKPIFENASVETHAIDLGAAEPADFDGLLAGIDCVYHCAWSTIPESSNLDPAADLKVNVGMTLELLNAMKRLGSGRLVFCSSGGTVYGPLAHAPAAETHPLEPIAAYGVSKLAAEKYMQLYRRLHGIDARVARIANPYGAGQDRKRPQGLVGTLVHRALSEEYIDIWGTGNAVRDFIHISDVTAALVALGLQDFEPHGSMPVFNFGSGVGCSVNQLVELVEDCIHVPLKIRRLEGRAFDVPTNVLDISKAAVQLNWTPQMNLRDGLVRMIEDLKTDRSRLFSSDL